MFTVINGVAVVSDRGRSRNDPSSSFFCKHFQGDETCFIDWLLSALGGAGTSDHATSTRRSLLLTVVSVGHAIDTVPEVGTAASCRCRDSVVIVPCTVFMVIVDG